MKDRVQILSDLNTLQNTLIQSVKQAIYTNTTRDIDGNELQIELIKIVEQLASVTRDIINNYLNTDSDANVYANYTRVFVVSQLLDLTTNIIPSGDIISVTPSGLGDPEFGDIAVNLGDGYTYVLTSASPNKWIAFSTVGVSSNVVNIRENGVVVGSGQANLLNFTNGTLVESPSGQYAITVSGGVTPEEVQDIMASTLVNGTNVTIVYDDIANTITINSTGGLTLEEVQDAVDALIQDGTGISWVYDDALATLTPTVTLAPFTTTNLAEGSNQYFTEARVRATLLSGLSITNSAIVAGDSVLAGLGKAQGQINNITSTFNETAQDAVGSILTDSTTIDFTYNDAGNTITAIVIDASITNAKLATMAANTVKVNATSGTATPTDLALTANSVLGRASTGNIVALPVTESIAGTNLMVAGTFTVTDSRLTTSSRCVGAIWTNTGTLTGIVKGIPASGSMAITSTVGTDTAEIGYLIII